MTGIDGTDEIIAFAELRRSFVVRSKAGGRRRTKRVVRAVDGISATIAPGESVGYIGANGAGKSTTVKMITGVLVPTGGTVRTCGFDPVPQRRQLARQVGVVFGQRSQLWWDMPLRDSFRILAAIHRMPAEAAKPRIGELVGELELDHLLDTPVGQLSLGERMRGEVAAALVHRPRLLVLDEPTIGLDVLSKERLRQFLIAERARENMTLLLTENWSRTTSTRRWNLLYVTTFRGLALRSRGQDGLGAGRVSVGQMVRSLGMRIQPMK